VGLPFYILAGLLIASSVAAMTLRNLVHCALAVAVAFTSLAAVYLSLNAQFVGFTQILVYVGAVAILIVVATLLTRGGEEKGRLAINRSAIIGIGITVVVLGALVWAISHSGIVKGPVAPKPDAPVKQIGDALMTKFVLPLEVIGLLLTAAMVGAVIIAMHDDGDKMKMEDGGSKMDKPTSSGGAA
jgi:NADH-quinone oxidoreductase subunit J